MASTVGEKCGCIYLRFASTLCYTYVCNFSLRNALS